VIEASPRHLAIIFRILEKYAPGYEARVFGSRLNPEAELYADLDLVLVGPEALAPRTFYAIKEELEDAGLPFRVDLMDWHIIPARLQLEISRNYEVLR